MPLSTPVIAVTYAEIALKGKNRPMFQRRLVNNIRTALKGEPVAGVDHVESRFLVRLANVERAGAVCQKLSRVFGIQWLSPAVPVQRVTVAVTEDQTPTAGAADKRTTTDLPIADDTVLAEVCRVARTLARDDVGAARNFKVEARRSDRGFFLVSPEINRIVGAAVAEELDLPARMTNPEFTVQILVLKRQVLVFTRKIPGHGGLPSGSGGRVTCLFSGGIDSPVASWMLMRRGCRCEFVHFYSGRSPAEADVSKIKVLVSILARYAPVPLTLYLVPVVPYELRAIGNIADSYDMVMFRRFMVRTAARLARRASCLALVTGDSLGQVASQTLANLAAISPDVDLPILRPLIGLDKVAITGLARKIGTYETSIQPYRDCCSIRSPRPVLHARAHDLLRYSDDMDMEGAVEEAVASATKVVLDTEGEVG